MTRTTRPAGTASLTSAVFDEFAGRDEFLGFGYIGGRSNALDGTDPESPATPDLVALVDAAVLTRAADLGWDADRLFEWANSKDGRWYADEMFGSPSNPDPAVAYADALVTAYVYMR